MEKISNKKQLKIWLNYELSRINGGYSLFDFLELTESNIIRKYITILRKLEYYTNTDHKLLKILYKIRHMRISNKYSIHIPINTCEMGLKIMHVGPILINPKAQIGKNCSIHINTAIAAGGRDNGVPTVGDNVVIGVGAKLIGTIKIADDIAIGANAVVNKSFLETSIAIAGIPAKKISNNGRSTWNKD